MKTTFLIFLLLLFPALGGAQVFSVSSTHVAQGDTLVFTVGPQWRTPGVAVRVFDKTFEANRSGMMYVGVDPDIAPGKYAAFLVDARTGIRTDWYYEEIEVAKRNFLEVKLSFRAPRASSSARRAREAAAISAAYARGNSYENYAAGEYSYPINPLPIITGEFYSKRIYTDGMIAHRGVDLRAAKGVPVTAINAGRVVLAVRNFSLEGNAVIVDHGSGIFSVYIHFSKLEVKEGQTVNKGQVLGLAGATGDARGPHLHFMVKVGGVAVDPLRFVEIANSNLIK